MTNRNPHCSRALKTSFLRSVRTDPAICAKIAAALPTSLAIGCARGDRLKHSDLIQQRKAGL